MRLSVLFRTILVIASCSSIQCHEKAILMDYDPATVINGEYIVVFKQDAHNYEIEKHKKHVHNMARYAGVNYKIRHEFDIGASSRFCGYSAQMDDRMVHIVLNRKEVAYVERNHNGHVLYDKCDRIQKTAPWGISRTATEVWPHYDDMKDYANLSFKYRYSNKDSGKNVDVYIIDTGIDTKHQDFRGRAKFGVDLVDSPANKGDPMGHGTHVAGTIMSISCGIAKKATAIAVRVCNSNGACALDGVIKGVDWAVNQHKSKKNKRSVANMSLGAPISRALNEAVNAAIKNGLHIISAAGNNNEDACKMSPASSNSISVAASDINDKKASFSNYGSCVNLIAPGVNIMSTLPNGKLGVMSGTSMSSPHVTGVVAKLLSKYSSSDISQANLLAELKRRAQKGKITGWPSSPPTPNELVFMECGKTN